MTMRLRTFFLLLAVAALAVNSADRVAGWGDGLSHAVGMAVMIIVMLASFPFLDPSKGTGPSGSDGRR